MYGAAVPGCREGGGKFDQRRNTTHVGTQRTRIVLPGNRRTTDGGRDPRRTPRRLFHTGTPEWSRTRPPGRHFPGDRDDVSPDGQRFLMLKERERRKADEMPSQLIVVLNWLEELKRLAPAN